LIGAKNDDAFVPSSDRLELLERLAAGVAVADRAARRGAEDVSSCVSVFRATVSGDF